ncbi:MAG TPA: FAD-dependent oxidoreductase [Thermomicrobiales bacterium]|jgi:glycine/D-amino acid oxidase-like deaminating enzyme|nr:FAD-dependent oxidoreductase [Thermomicrobiales bacterium]
MWSPQTSLVDAEPAVYWTSQPRPVPIQPPLRTNATADLVIIGGGFTGLWAAIEAKQRDPNRDVVLLEMERIAFGATGRNGGFLEPSLTHGLENGLARYPADEMRTLLRLGNENYAEIADFIHAHQIDCDLQEHGVIWAATAPYLSEAIPKIVTLLREWGQDTVALSAEELRAEVDSPFYLGGVWSRGEGGLVDPARLAWELLRVALELGVRVHERTRVTGLVDAGARMVVRTAGASILAGKVLHATSAYPGVIPETRRYVVPVYDYVLMSEPLTEAQRAAIGWRTRFGLSDGDNQFVYHRMTADHRILYGGWDAVFHRKGVDPSFDQRDASHQFLAERFFRTFPQLEGLRFTHRWGGAIDTCSRFAVFFNTTHGGKVAYAAGYTGLGVGASRFGARTALDLLDGQSTERTELRLTRKRPVPFPPEPVRSAVIGFTQREIARADRSQGQRGLWLRTLDRLGLGFDS